MLGYDKAKGPRDSEDVAGGGPPPTGPLFPVEPTPPRASSRACRPALSEGRVVRDVGMNANKLCVGRSPTERLAVTARRESAKTERNAHEEGMPSPPHIRNGPTPVLTPRTRPKHSPGAIERKCWNRCSETGASYPAPAGGLVGGAKQQVISLTGTGRGRADEARGPSRGLHGRSKICEANAETSPRLGDFMRNYF